MIKFLWHLIVIIAKHQDMDYVTAYWFKSSGGMNIVGYRDDEKVYDYDKRGGKKWENLIREL